MRKAWVIAGFLSLTAAFPSFDARADSFSCDGGIVSAGDRSSDLLVKCGPADFRDSHQEVVEQQLDDTTQHKLYVTVDEWTYDLGPNRFMRIVVMKNGVITEIRTGSYGFPIQ